MAAVTAVMCPMTHVAAKGTLHLTEVYEIHSVAVHLLFPVVREWVREWFMPINL